MNRAVLKARSRASMMWSRPGVLTVGMARWFCLWIVNWFAGQAPLLSLNPGLGLAPALYTPRGAAIALLSLAALILTGVIEAGYSQNYALKVARNQPAGLGSLFELAQHGGRFILLPLAVSLIPILPLLPAGAALAVGISRHGAQVLELLDGLTQGLAGSAPLAQLEPLQALLLEAYGRIFSWQFWVLALAGGALAVFLSLTYAQALLVAVDSPETPMRGCLRRSRALMRGRRGELLLLRLSFALWLLAPALGAGLLLTPSALATLGAGGAMLLTLWAEAYQKVTLSNYYCLITGQLPVKNQPPREFQLLQRHLFSAAPEAEEENPADPPAGEGENGDSDPGAPPEEDERRRLIEEMWKR